MSEIDFTPSLQMLERIFWMKLSCMTEVVFGQAQKWSFRVSEELHKFSFAANPIEDLQY